MPPDSKDRRPRSKRARARRAARGSPTRLTIALSEQRRAYLVKLQERLQLERRELIRRWAILLSGVAVLLVVVAVVGTLLSPARSDGPLADAELGACRTCIEYLQEQGGLPDGAEFPSCLLEVGARYRGDGLYEVRSGYSFPAAPGEAGVQNYECSVQRFADGSWLITDFRLEE